jgi:hypothetical protein
LLASGEAILSRNISRQTNRWRLPLNNQSEEQACGDVKGIEEPMTEIKTSK